MKTEARIETLVQDLKNGLGAALFGIGMVLYGYCRVLVSPPSPPAACTPQVAFLECSPLVFFMP